MTNREEDELLSQSVIADCQTTGEKSPTVTTIHKNDEDSGNSTLKSSDKSSEAQNGTNIATAATDIAAPESNGIITDIHWSENLPSSASPSSGFSDDDSLTGANDVGDAKTIEQIVEMVKQMGKKGLVKEYAEIRSRQPDGTFDNAKLRSNLTKNRYTDVLCFDHSRVILAQNENNEDDPTCDYINANFVDGYKQKNAYISTQGKFLNCFQYKDPSHANVFLGPLPKTAPDFWQMVWDQQCLVIVMTTKTMERGRVKCHQYWESTVGEESVYGNFTVKTTSIDSNEDYTIASIEIKNSKVKVLSSSYF
jgi:tyrosine-protein phosphatase non-receptor type 9